MFDTDANSRWFRGRSHVGADLSGADLTGTDLRGVDFTHADLSGADLTRARLGLRPPWAVLLFVASLLIVAATGWLIGWTLRSLTDGFGGADWEEQFGRALAFVVLGLFVVCAIAFGLPRALRYGAVLFIGGLAVNYAVIAATSQDFDLARDGRVIGVVLLLAASMIAGGIARIVGGSAATWAIVVVGLTGGLAAGRGGGGVAGVVVSVLLVVLAKRALRLDQRDRQVRRLVHAIVSQHGTRFTNANLSEANLTGTRLALSDLTGADLRGAQLDDFEGWPPFVDPRPSTRPD